MTLRLVRVGLAAVALTAATAWLAPSARATTPGSGYRMLASAAAGSVYVNDPTFLVPYADQIISQADTELSAVGASAVATPLAPGSAASLVPTLVVVACPTCPPVPAPVNLKAEARPPANEQSDANAAGATGGPVTVEGPKASATARTGIDAEAKAETSKVAGLAPTAAASMTNTRATLHAPSDANDGVAEARAVSGFGGYTFIAYSSLLPHSATSVGVEQPDGSTTPLSDEGMPVGDGRVYPATESGPGFARAGVLFERKEASGSVQRSAIALTSVQLLGVFAADPVSSADSDAAPLAANTSALGVLSAAAPSLSVAPAARAPFAANSVSRPVRAAKAVESPLGRWRDRAWLLWVYLGWLAIGALATAAGRRYLAPLIAERAAAERLARAGRVDHLDARA